MSSIDLLRVLPSLRAVAAPTLLAHSNDTAPVTLEVKDQPVLHAVGNSFLCVYLIDTGEHWRYVQQGELAVLKAHNAKADIRGLHEFALINLARLASEKLRLMPLANSQGLLLDGQFEASLLLQDDLWDESLASYAPNGFIAAAPTRDVLAFCDSKSEQGIRELTELAQCTYNNGQHRISPALLERINGEWRVRS
jgi:uncharacterized protein YtpQ (UPF0354 family)